MNAGNGTFHVAHLVGSTGLYGAERWILALMRAMDTQRVRSTVVNLVDVEGDKSAIVQAAEQRGLAAIDFVTGGKFNPFAAFRLARWAREQQVHILHGHGYKSDLLGLMAARLAGRRMMTTPHGWSLENDLKLQFYEKIDRFSFRFMDMVCPLSTDLAHGIKNVVDNKKLRLVFNGVDIDEVQAALPVNKRNDDCFVLGYIGQLIDRKDLLTLISAVKVLVDKRKKLQLVVVGYGPNLPSLKVEASRLGIDSITDFTGFRTDAAGFLKTFDAFALTSRLEGIPRCIMEAMAVGVPVVVSDIPGNRDLVLHGETGLLFRLGNSYDLAEKITYIMDHPSEARIMANRGKLKVEQEYSNRKMAREYTKIYCDLMKI